MSKDIIRVQRIAQAIFVLRGQKVILGQDLAALYGVTVGVLTQAMKRNTKRFPKDFVFQVTAEELRNLKSQIVISSWGGRRHLPYAFTEQGVAMLSSVLNSERAVKAAALSDAQARMIVWTIYITFAGAVLLLILPRVFARWIALATTAGGL